MLQTKRLPSTAIMLRVVRFARNRGIIKNTFAVYSRALKKDRRREEYGDTE